MQCKSVLIVEDDADIRENLQDILTFEGHQVHSVQNGQEALDYISNSSEDPGVILLDLMMPIMTGAEFLVRFGKDLPEKAKEIPVIVLSAAGEAVRSSVVATTSVKKPVDLDELLALVEKYCGVPNRV